MRNCLDTCDLIPALWRLLKRHRVGPRRHPGLRCGSRRPRVCELHRRRRRSGMMVKCGAGWRQTVADAAVHACGRRCRVVRSGHGSVLIQVRWRQEGGGRMVGGMRVRVMVGCVHRGRWVRRMEAPFIHVLLKMLSLILIILKVATDKHQQFHMYTYRQLY